MITTEQRIEFHKKSLWSRYLAVLLGFWLIATIYTRGDPTGTPIFYNNLICGLLIIFFGSLALKPKFSWTGWVVALVGTWLAASPVFLWAPTITAYNNSSLVGILAILFGIILPGLPHDELTKGKNIPPGWTYNPSSMEQRAPIMFLVFCCWMSSRYMATYQLGYIDVMHDPIWGNDGTIKVITSALSKSFPISDAGLAAFLYSFEFIAVAKGSEHRWRTVPWIVLGFGFLVVPVGLMSIFLIMLQPIVVGYWCFWCLFTAFCMLLIIALTVDEVWAAAQHFVRSIKSGTPWKKALFLGGDIDEVDSGEENFHRLAMTAGTNFHWTLLLSAALGAWLMASPSYIDLGKFSADSDYITGALVVVFSIISAAQVIRKIRYLNAVAGIWLILCPFFSLATTTPHHQWSNIAVGIILILLTIPKGDLRDCNSP